MVGAWRDRRKKGRMMLSSIRHRISRKRLVSTLLLSAILLLLMPSLSLSARNSYVFESNLQGEMLDAKVKEILNQLDHDGYTTPEETQGFRYRISSNLFSPFSYEIYTGIISNKNPTNIIRVEGDAGDALLLARMFEAEEILTEPFRGGQGAVKITDKSHLASQGLNLVAPWLAVFYNGHRSPRLTSSQVLFRGALYLGLDLLLASAAGTNFYQEKFDMEKYGDRVLLGLALNRIAGAIDSYQTIRGHNRVAELKYTFYLDD